MRVSPITAKRFFKDVGAERVSEDAALELADMLNRYAYSIAKKATRLSAHAKRKTVKRADVLLAH